MIFLFVFFLDVFLLLLLLLSDAIDFGTRRSFFRVVRKRKKTKNGNAGFFFSSSPSTEENESGEGDNKTPKTATVGRHRSRPSAPSRFIKRRR